MEEHKGDTMIEGRVIAHLLADACDAAEKEPEGERYEALRYYLVDIVDNLNQGHIPFFKEGAA